MSSSWLVRENKQTAFKCITLDVMDQELEKKLY